MVNKIEVTRSFSQKIKIGDYLTADFFSSAKAEVPEEEAEKESEKLYAFVRNEVKKSIKAYLDEKNDKAIKDWSEHKQHLYNRDSELDEANRELQEEKETNE